MSKENLKESIKKLIADYRPVEGEEQVAAAYLFGSHARGEASSNSDLDLAILFARSPESTLKGIGQRLASQLEIELGKEVDLIVLNKASAELVHKILKEGYLLIDRDPSLRVSFEVKKRNEYFDLLPILNEYRLSSKEVA